MSGLQEIVDGQCASGAVPGAIAIVAEGDTLTVAVGGVRTIGGAPMTRDSLFRIASITKPIMAAATMVLVEQGRFGLDDPVARWLPELSQVALGGPDDFSSLGAFLTWVASRR